MRPRRAWWRRLCSEQRTSAASKRCSGDHAGSTSRRVPSSARSAPPSSRSIAKRNSWALIAIPGHLAVRIGSYAESVIRLRTLTEAECYARCYRGWDPTVTVTRLEPRRPRFPTTVSGEDLRRDLEERLDARLAAEPEAA